MRNLKQFEEFAKGKPQKTESSNNTCVIYTRISTREQAENNMSLDTQRRAYDKYAKKLGYTIMAYFGGTYENAKTDERKEFNHMLSFVQKSREKISNIIVYSVDRFSRSGANAIYITEQLKQTRISVLSVSQPTDVSTPSGSLQQNIQFIFTPHFCGEYSVYSPQHRILVQSPLGNEKKQRGEIQFDLPEAENVRKKVSSSGVENARGKLFYLFLQQASLLFARSKNNIRLFLTLPSVKKSLYTRTKKQDIIKFGGLPAGNIAEQIKIIGIHLKIKGNFF